MQSTKPKCKSVKGLQYDSVKVQKVYSTPNMMPFLSSNIYRGSENICLVSNCKQAY